MKILITGGAGFIGSAVVRAGVDKGDTVINVDALKYSGNAKEILGDNEDPGYWKCNGMLSQKHHEIYLSTMEHNKNAMDYNVRFTKIQLLTSESAGEVIIPNYLQVRSFSWLAMVCHFLLVIACFRVWCAW